MDFKAENFTDAIDELEEKFSLDSYDFKKDPYHIIAFYQAISARKMEKSLQELVDEIKTLNSKLDDIKGQMSSNASTISTAINNISWS